MHQTISAMFKHFGAKSISLGEFRDQWSQPYMSFYNKYIPDISLEEEKAFFIKHISQFPPTPYPGICQLITDLKQNNKNLFVISSDNQEVLLSQIEKFGLTNIFDEIYCDIYDKNLGHKNLIENNQLNKSETVTIGDTTYEISCGNELGISTIGVTWGIHQKQKLLTEKPTHIVDSIFELRDLL